MENNKKIIPEKTAIALQVGVRLLEIMKSKNRNFSEADFEETKNCILQGANLNEWKIGENKESILHLAVKHQQKDLFEFLLKNKADINIRDKNKQTPLHCLIRTYGDHAKLEIDIKDLIKHKADINAKALFEDLHSYSNYMNFLIQNGADIYEIISTPLAIIINPLRDKTSIVKELCKYRASLVNITTKNNNIFHRITKVTSDTSQTLTDTGLISAKYIKTLITHARFDDFDKGSKKTVLFALWFFEQLRLNNKIFIPNDIKLHILAQLPLSNLYPYKKLCEV